MPRSVRHRNSWPERRPDDEVCDTLSKPIGERCSRSSFGRMIVTSQRTKPMPYAPEHKHATREKILESARQVFNRNGYAAAVRQFLCTRTPPAWRKRRGPGALRKSQAQRIVEAYFSREHFEDRDGCCPLLGTASDIQRSGAAVKAA